MTSPATGDAASNLSAVYDDRRFFGHPRGLGLLFTFLAVRQLRRAGLLR